MINEERIFRALERIEAKQGEHTERLAVVETKVDEVRKEACERDKKLEEQGQALSQMNGVIKVVGWLGTVGGAGGLLAAAKGFLFGAQ